MAPWYYKWVNLTMSWLNLVLLGPLQLSAMWWRWKAQTKNGRRNQEGDIPYPGLRDGRGFLVLCKMWEECWPFFCISSCMFHWKGVLDWFIKVFPERVPLCFPYQKNQGHYIQRYMIILIYIDYIQEQPARKVSGVQSVRNDKMSLEM